MTPNAIKKIIDYPSSVFTALGHRLTSVSESPVMTRAHVNEMRD
jgi:hypothetical protein